MEIVDLGPVSILIYSCSSIALTTHSKKQIARAGDMAQWVKCLLHKHEESSSDPQHPHKKLSISAYTCKYQHWGKRQEDPGALMVNQVS